MTEINKLLIAENMLLDVGHEGLLSENTELRLQCAIAHSVFSIAESLEKIANELIDIKGRMP